VLFLDGVRYKFLLHGEYQNLSPFFSNHRKGELPGILGAVSLDFAFDNMCSSRGIGRKMQVICESLGAVGAGHSNFRIADHITA
jgi:hypothetical protein